MKRLAILVLLGAACLGAGEAVMAAPNRMELYLDGARLAYGLDLPAGRSRVLLPGNLGNLVQVNGADGWVIETSINTAEAPPMPPDVVELTARVEGLEREATLLDGEDEAISRVAAELELRLGQRGVLAGDETAAWQEALDGMLGQRKGLAQRRHVHTAAWRDLRDRAAAEAAPGITYAMVLGLNGQRLTNAVGDPEVNARRSWNIAVERSVLARFLVIERHEPGVVTVITERTDLRWAPRSRLVVVHGGAILVRQAAVQVPAGLALPPIPARLVGGIRAQPLSGNDLVPRYVTAGNAPQAERRSVTTTARPVGWAAGSAPVAGREQTWELPALTLAAPLERSAEVMAELHKGPVELHADEWVLAPDLAQVLVRRLSVRLDHQPLAAGIIELVVDGTVLGRRQVPATASGSLLHFAAGEDQRVFLAETTRWIEDPNRPVNRKREGTDYRLRNLSTEAVTFACYLTQPISAAKGVTITTDETTTAGSAQAQNGLLRWTLTVEAGAELVLHHGWTIEAEGKIKL